MIIDLSHPIDSEIPMFPGFPPPAIETHISREDSRSHYTGGVEFLIQRLTFIGNTGTYLDAPFHRYPDGTDLAALSLDRLCDLPGVVVQVGQGAISDESVPLDIEGCAVLFHTGWDKGWGTSDYLASNPHLTAGAAIALRDRGVALVGIDSWNVDDVRDGTRPVHSILLQAGIPVVENLCNLGEIPARGFRFFAPVLPVQGGAAVPVRAFANAGDG